MKTYKTEADMLKDVKNGCLVVEDSLTLEFNMNIRININAGDITAGDINAGDITAGDINAGDINAGDITARDITAGDINARDINARDITAWDINAGDITAWDINAGDIMYYAFCCVYKSIYCLSIKAKREKSKKPICLDGKLTIKKAV